MHLVLTMSLEYNIIVPVCQLEHRFGLRAEVGWLAWQMGIGNRSLATVDVERNSRNDDDDEKQSEELRRAR